MDEIVTIDEYPTRRMVATILPRSKEDATTTVHASQTFGDIDFWNVRSNYLSFDESRGQNTMENDYYSFVAVTLNGSKNLPVKKKIKKDNTSSGKQITEFVKGIFSWISDSGWAESLLFFGFSVAGLLALIRGAEFDDSIFELLVFLFFLVISITFFIMTGLSIMDGKKAFRDKKVRSPKLKKLGHFPADEKFIVMDSKTAKLTINVLSKNSSSLMNSLVSRKLEIDKNRDSFNEWITAVSTIVDNDPNFPVEAIPLTNAKVVEVSTNLQIQVEKEKQAAREIEESNRQKELAQSIILEDTDLEIMNKYAYNDSVRAAEIAEDYITSRKITNMTD